MTEKMSKDLINTMRKKIKWLTAAVIVLTMLFVAMTAFAFSEFDLYIEYDDSQHIEQITDGQSDGAVNQNSEMYGKSDLSLICGTIIACVVVITIGAVVGYAVTRKSKQVNEYFAKSAERRTKQDNDDAQQDTSNNT